MPKLRYVTIDGETLNVAKWARRSGVARATVSARLDNGWDPKKAVFAPTQRMSSTGRGGAPRVDNDKYYTPDWLVDEGIKIMQSHGYSKSVAGLWLLEPACGGGAIVGKLQESFPEARVDCFDVAPDEDFTCKQQDFFEFEYRCHDRPHAIITNPPYNEAQRFTEHAISLVRDGGLVIMLLRINFFGGQKRSAWLEKNMPIEVHVTPRRPSFRGKGTDSSEYAWFVWQKGEHPEFTKTFLLDTRVDRYRK